MVVTLPPEITDMIISLVNSPKSLCNCALVCHDWLPASRCRLFYRTCVRTARSYDLLITRIARNESMGLWLGWMHTFAVDGRTSLVDSMRGLYRKAHGQSFLNSDPAWTRRFILDLPSHTPNLTCLELFFVDWIEHSPHPATFRAFSQFSSVTTFAVHECRFPSFTAFRQAIVSLPSLTTLTLGNFIWPPEPEQSTWRLTCYQARPKLQTLIVTPQLPSSGTGMFALFPWILRTPTKHTLRHLVLCPGSALSLDPDPEHRNMTRFLEAVAPSLLSLRIDFLSGELST